MAAPGGWFGVYVCFFSRGACGWAIENRRGLLANGRVELCFLSSFPCAGGGGGGSEGWVSVGFPGHPPPPPFVPVIYKAPLRDDLGQYSAPLFVGTRKKCGPEVRPPPPPPFSFSSFPSSMPPVFTLVVRLGPHEARDEPDSVKQMDG